MVDTMASQERVEYVHMDIGHDLGIWAGLHHRQSVARGNRLLAWHLNASGSDFTSPCGAKPALTESPKRFNVVPNICRKCAEEATARGINMQEVVAEANRRIVASARASRPRP